MKARISFIVVLYNQQHDADELLTPLFELDEPRAELIIINDGSTDGTDDAVASLLEYHNHDRAFYFENELRKGMALSLNDGLQHCSTDTVIVIDRSGTFQPDILKDALSHLDRTDSIAVASTHTGFSGSNEFLQEMLDKRVLPASSNFILRISRVRPDRLFFNPFLTHGHVAELLFRLQDEERITAGPAVIELEEKDEWISLDASAYDALVFTGRRCGLKITHKQSELKNADKSMPALSADDMVEEATDLIEDGQFHNAMTLLNKALDLDPDNDDAMTLKVRVLERLKRYVEASELKHTQKKNRALADGENDNKPDETEPEDQPDDAEETQEPAESDSEEDTPAIIGKSYPEIEKPRISVIIPTSGHGLGLLEPALISLDDHADPSETELIVIDNASLDDTFEYLENLKKSNFFNIRVVKNQRNAGFAKSMNQGVKEARGKFIVVMHNDVILQNNAPGLLADILDGNPEIGIVGPMTNLSLNPDQEGQSDDNPTSVTEVTYLDSFMMAYPKAGTPKMDEAYKLAYFDDLDLCWQIREAGKSVMLAEGVFVEHDMGATTTMMGLGLYSGLYGENNHLFREKWSIKTQTPVLPDDPDELEELVAIGMVINVTHPESYLAQKAKALFTDEVKTRLMQMKLDKEHLSAFIRVMMALDIRDVLRQLEEKYPEPFEPQLINELVRFYFDRHIYSRCLKYLNKWKGTLPLHLMMYHLKIDWKEKELDKAANKLNELFEVSPAHPELYQLAGEIYKIDGNKEEADKMMQIADQLDPFRFPFG